VHIDLTVQEQSGSRTARFFFDKMVNAGFSGRNQEKVQEHVRELAAKGIPAPSETPTLYPVVCQSLLCRSSIDVLGDKTSGEVEYVLFLDQEGGMYAGLGSDHTDRHLEETDIPRAKQICPNLVSDTVWPLSEVEAHWDDIVLKSAVTVNGETVPYQEGALGGVLSPRQMLDFVRSKVSCELKNMVIYSGTVAMLTDGFRYGERFEAEMVDPHLERRLGLQYAINNVESITA